MLFPFSAEVKLTGSANLQYASFITFRKAVRALGVSRDRADR